MPRSNPKRSDYCASRHLLRHLDDPRELRRNPLVSSLFPTSNMSRHRPPREDGDALVTIKRRVFAALARVLDEDVAGIAARDRTWSHAILLRCEIQRQPRSLVAAELALSLRSFQTARGVAHRLFLRALKTAAASPLVRRSRAALAVDDAVEMARRGGFDVAVGALKAIESAAQSGTERVEAICQRAEVDLHRFAFDSAHAAVREMEAVARASQDSATANAATLRTALVQATLERFTGVAFANGLPPALNHVLATIKDGSVGTDDLAKARLYTLAAQCLFETGSRSGALAAVRQASRHLQEAGESGLPLHELRLATADLESIGHPDIALCEGVYREACAFAERREYAGLALRARASLLAVQLAGGRIEPRTYRSRACELLQKTENLSGAIGKRVQLIVVDQLCEGLVTRDGPYRTLELCDRLERLAPANGFDAARVRLYRSFALARLRDYAEAERAAWDAVTAAERMRNVRLLSSGKLFFGMSIGRQGRRMAALAEIDTALPALARCGTPWQLNQAEALRRTIAGRHAAMVPSSKKPLVTGTARGSLTALG